jgi:hypothetical protein
MVKVEKVKSFYENFLLIINMLCIKICGKKLTIVTFDKFTKKKGAAWLSKVRCGSGRCGVAQLVARRLAVRQARVRFSARHFMEVLLLLSEEAMRIQEDRPRRMMKVE